MSYNIELKFLNGLLKDQVKTKRIKNEDILKTIDTEGYLMKNFNAKMKKLNIPLACPVKSNGIRCWDFSIPELKKWCDEVNNIKDFIDNYLYKTNDRKDKVKIQDLFELYNKYNEPIDYAESFTEKIKYFIPVCQKRIDKKYCFAIDGYQKGIKCWIEKQN